MALSKKTEETINQVVVVGMLSYQLFRLHGKSEQEATEKALRTTLESVFRAIQKVADEHKNEEAP
jgi:hypothetical protein